MCHFRSFEYIHDWKMKMHIPIVDICSRVHGLNDTIVYISSLRCDKEGSSVTLEKTKPTIWFRKWSALKRLNWLMFWIKRTINHAYNFTASRSNVYKQLQTAVFQTSVHVYLYSKWMALILHMYPWIKGNHLCGFHNCFLIMILIYICN